VAAGWYLLRFFRVVTPVPRLTIAGFVLLGAAAIVKTTMDPGATAGALVPLTVLQMFATSSGFVMPARRGYYDLVLTRAPGRAAIAIAHWAASATPGLATWLVVAATEWLVTAGASNLARASGTVVAMCLVSTVPWAATVSLPRFAGAIAWLLLFVTTATLAPAWLDGLLVSAGERHLDTMSPVAVLVFPIGLIGLDVGPAFTTVASAIVLALCAMGAALGWIHRAELALESAQ
jgi:hypothetical protein